MYICSCNALTVDSVVAAARGGAGTACPREAYRRLGCEPQCGGCLKRAGKILRERGGDMPLDAVPV